MFIINNTVNFSHKQLVLVAAPISIGAFLFKAGNLPVSKKTKKAARKRLTTGAFQIFTPFLPFLLHGEGLQG
ncbi:MAG: hypothetical protein BGP14_06635 [Sphingobacteriales bacterium 44-15]|nr:MAG: hypothetical protein BGP14_06635 [Sphingobacteriales bacterium 44-15]